MQPAVPVCLHLHETLIKWSEKRKVAVSKIIINKQTKSAGFCSEMFYISWRSLGWGVTFDILFLYTESLPDFRINFNWAVLRSKQKACHVLISVVVEIVLQLRGTECAIMQRKPAMCQMFYYMVFPSVSRHFWGPFWVLQHLLHCLRCHFITGCLPQRQVSQGFNHIYVGSAWY